MSSNNNDELKLEVLLIKKAALILRAINHPLRQQFLKLIYQHGQLPVTEIYTRLKLEQSVASQHLAILRRAGFVVTSRDGKNIYYSIHQHRLQEVQALIKELLD